MNSKARTHREVWRERRDEVRGAGGEIKQGKGGKNYRVLGEPWTYKG